MNWNPFKRTPAARKIAELQNTISSMQATINRLEKQAPIRAHIEQEMAGHDMGVSVTFSTLHLQNTPQAELVVDYVLEGIKRQLISHVPSKNRVH